MVEHPAGAARLIGNVRRQSHHAIRAAGRGVDSACRGDGEFGLARGDDAGVK